MKIKDLNKFAELIKECSKFVAENSDEISGVLTNAFKIDKEFANDCTCIHKALSAAGLEIKQEKISTSSKHDEVTSESTESVSSSDNIEYPPNINPKRIINITSDFTNWKYDDASDLWFSINGEPAICFNNKLFIITTSLEHYKYPIVNYRRKKILISTAMQRLFLGKKPVNGFIRFKDGNPQNCSKDNMEYSFTKQRYKETDTQSIEEVCLSLVKNGGSVINTFNDLDRKIEYQLIQRVSKKIIYSDISDKYFTLNKQGKIIPNISYDEKSSSKTDNKRGGVVHRNHILMDL